MFSNDAVTLRAVETDDIASIHDYLNHPDLYGRCYLDHDAPGPVSQRAVAGQVEAWQDLDHGLALVVEASGEVAGHTVAWWNWDPIAPELAVVIDPRRQGAGLGGETLRLMVRWLFRQTVASNVGCWVADWNGAGLRFAVRHGFTRTGASRRAGIARGRWYDNAVFDLLREEWEASDAAAG
jgi:RimJ/RimL family protein N-acetyltransferase